MTGEPREQNDPGQAPEQEKPRAVVVAVDPGRLELYGRTLRLAEVPNLATLDLDEAEQLLIEHQPAVLVLDHGLPRVYILRLYGLVREVMEGPRVKVLFVGQEARADAEASSDDYYLPGEPSPLDVAAQVCEMVAEADAAQPAAAATGVPTPTASDASPPDDAEPAPATEAVAVAEQDVRMGDASEPPPGAAAASRVDDEPDTVSATDDRSEPSSQPAAEAAFVGSGVATGTAASPPDTTATDVSTATAAPTAAEASPEDAPAEPPRKRRRFDVLMFRIGLVLLILGGLVAFIRPESFSLPMSAPPREAPTPLPATPTQQPAASPSPAAFLDPTTLPAHIAAHRW